MMFPSNKEWSLVELSVLTSNISIGVLVIMFSVIGSLTLYVTESIFVFEVLFIELIVYS